MLFCNVYEIFEIFWKLGDFIVINSIEIGFGVYVFFSFINYFCDFLVVRYNYGNICVVRVIKFIKKGEEIFDNYGVLYLLIIREERRVKLRL